MNFIGKRADVQTRLELKYCERCGGLFLRPAGMRAVQCDRCHKRRLALGSTALEAFNVESRRRGRPRSRTSKAYADFQNPPWIGDLQAVVADELGTAEARSC
jgi:DNA-directed RNA polymerase subunit RPC12/RpoP